MKKLFLFAMGFWLAVALTGCETMKGFGKDIVNTSSAVQRSLSH